MTTSTIVLVALGPAVVIVPVLLAGVVAGLFKIFGKKKATDTPPSIASAPFLDMRAGTTTAHLERKGNLWQWSLSGGSTIASSDADAGKAATAMAESLATTEEYTAITGSAGGPGMSTYDFGVQGEDPEGGGGWSWSVTTASKLPNIGDKPAPPSMEGGGTEAQRGVAILRALAKISTKLPWLNVPDPAGKVGGGLEPPKNLPGVIIHGNTVAVTDLPTWIAYAAPKMRVPLDNGSTADEIMDAVVMDLPENATLSGKTIQDVRKRVSDFLDLVHSDKYVAVAAPDEELAALIVGKDLRPGGWVALEYKGHVILLRPTKGGKPGADWDYLIWEGGSRGYDDAAARVGSLGPNKTRAQNEAAAKKLIDQKINAGGEWPGGGDAGGNQTGQAKGPDPIIVQGAAFIPPVMSSEAYMPAVKKISLGPTMWTKSNHKDVEIFDFKDKQFYSFKHWRIVVGICMRAVDSKYPFGVLSQWMEQNEGAFGGMTAAQANKVKIRNAADPGFIGDGPPVVWDLFTKPLLWKGQFDGAVHAGPTIGIDAFQDITGTGEGEQVDPCEKDDAHWPTPSNPEVGFYVQPTGSVNFLQWKPMPTVELITRGTKVLARIHYRGFPAFVMGSGVAQAGSATTKFKLDVQIWAAGTNEET